MATLGLLFIASVPVIFTVAGLIAGQEIGSDLGFFGAVFAIAIVGAVLVSRLGTAGRIAGIVASLLAFGGMFWATFGLFAPAAFADFLPGMLMPLGFLMGLGGSITALVQNRKGNIRAEAGPGESKIMRGALILVAVGMVVSAIMTVTGRTTVDAAAAEGATPVTMKNFDFAGTLEIAAGSPAKVLVHNSDAFVHDFAIPALDIEATAVNPGSDLLLDVTAPAGTYTVYCTLHSDVSESDPEKAGMATTLVAK